MLDLCALKQRPLLPVELLVVIVVGKLFFGKSREPLFREVAFEFHVAIRFHCFKIVFFHVGTYTHTHIRKKSGALKAEFKTNEIFNAYKLQTATFILRKSGVFYANFSFSLKILLVRSSSERY